MRPEPGSFRDRSARVFYSGDRVLRGLSAQALDQWQALAATRFFPELQNAGRVVGTRLLSPEDAAAFASASWASVLSHETIPFISYPYEWPFEMLKDAALLQLDLLSAALDENFILKDSSAFNIQWVGARPTFIDISSFERLLPGEPWVGYRQFCQMFLYPLMLQAYKDVPFQPWLRGSIDGISPEACNRLMSLRDLVRPGIFAHVFLQARLAQGFAGASSDVKQELREVGFHKELIRHNVARLTALVGRLERPSRRSEWSEYTNEHRYTDKDQAAKTAFVADVAASKAWGLVWDLGGNTGVYSRIAATNARYVVCMDSDELAVDHLYRSLKKDRHPSILPLHVNLADPSPNLGWRGLERSDLPSRGRPDLTLCLALIHHLAITANTPVSEVIDWLAGLGSALVIEFPTKQDPMVKRLLRNKRDNYADYTVEEFERRLAARFTIVRKTALESGTRLLYYATPHRV